MIYNLALMDDRIKLLKIQPTKKHRNGIIWIIRNRYGDDVTDETKKKFMEVFKKA
jgi:hypothetical protein